MRSKRKQSGYDTLPVILFHRYKYRDRESPFRTRKGFYFVLKPTGIIKI